MVDDLFGADAVNVFEQSAGTLPLSLYLSRELWAKEDMNRIKEAVASCRSGDLISDLK